MSAPLPYLLDTNVVLFATREGSAQAEAIDRQFGLRSSPFRPALCEVSVAELLAFSQSWGERRRKLLDEVIDEHVVLPIGRREIHEEWARLKSHAKAKGLAIQHDHNDLWIAATARVAGLTVMSTDLAAFLPLRDTLALELLNPQTGMRVP
ncbi:MAG: type II toxin-antitoxin system VapC family toxin [Betaproteobacteria bacterium]